MPLVARHKRSLAFALGLTLLVFALDLATPGGFDVGILYVPVLILASRAEGRRPPVAFAAITSTLVAAGGLLPDVVADPATMLINRLLSVAAIWIVTFLLLQRKRLETRLAWLAYHDQLTELPNRSLFLDRLEVALARAERGRSKLALVCLDLDGFKRVNDRYGHAAGDALLVEVAQRLAGVVRKSDTVSRFGGDEFFLLLEEVTDRENLGATLRRVTAALAAPIELGGDTLFISAAIGAAIYPDSSQDVGALFRGADAAMYRAKETSREFEICKDDDAVKGEAPEPLGLDPRSAED